MYGQMWAGMIERARTAKATSVPAMVRRAEIIDLAIQGLTIEQMRALWVSWYSGQPMPRGLRRAEVAAKLREKALESVRPKPVDQELFDRTAPQWNCVDYPGDGPHYTPGSGRCAWCGMTTAEIAAEWDAR